MLCFLNSSNGNVVHLSLKLDNILLIHSVTGVFDFDYNVIPFFIYPDEYPSLCGFRLDAVNAGILNECNERKLGDQNLLALFGGSSGAGDRHR